MGALIVVAGGDSEHCSLFHSDEVKEWNDRVNADEHWSGNPFFWIGCLGGKRAIS
ncbi:MAG: hypothetical protein NW701_16510 [Nitrospira sp.]